MPNIIGDQYEAAHPVRADSFWSDKRLILRSSRNLDPIYYMAFFMNGYETTLYHPASEKKP